MRIAVSARSPSMSTASTRFRGVATSGAGSGGGMNTGPGRLRLPTAARSARSSAPARPTSTSARSSGTAARACTESGRLLRRRLPCGAALDTVVPEARTAMLRFYARDSSGARPTASAARGRCG